MKKKLIILGIVIVLIAGAIFLVIKKQHDVASLPKPAANLQTVQTAVVTQGNLEVITHYLGVMESYTRSDLSARISGNILTINKREGDSIGSGELLVVIDDRELTDRAQAVDAEARATQQRLIGAKSAYETQKSIYERDVSLYSDGAISKEALERSHAAFDGAQATLSAFQESLQGMKKSTAAAQTQADYAKIYAPFAGMVSKRWSDPGDLAIPGKPILTVEKSSPCKVVVQIPQEEINRVKKGTKVYLLNGDQRLTAMVDRIYPALGKNLLGAVEIILNARPFNLPSGSTVGVDLVVNQVAGFLVPVNAVVKTGQGAFVYVLDKNVVRIKPVGALGTGAGQTAISGPVSVGDVIAVGQENRLLGLKEGSTVQSAGGDKP
jgi:RND family efflux transporter MFP subunit